jgi:hypothetical protein
LTKGVQKKGVKGFRGKILDSLACWQIRAVPSLVTTPVNLEGDL